MRRIFVVLACALVLGGCAYAIFDLNGQSFDLSDREVVLVVTDSMDGDVTEYAVDSFPADTLVMVQHISDLDKRFLRVGDVISFKEGSVLIQHRIIQMESDFAYVKGDNGHSTDKVYLDQINGKVVGTNWVAGHIVSLIVNNYILFLAVMFVVCSALIFAAFYPRSNVKKEVD